MKTDNGYKHWSVTRTVELNATAEEVWNVIGGFYTIHDWHPDITDTEVPREQNEVRQLRRLLTFPGQPKTTEELVFMDDPDFHYRYKWYAGEWGEDVKNYQAWLRVFAGDQNKTCTVQWSSTFDYPTDAISEFYLHGFKALQGLFAVRTKE